MYLAWTILEETIVYIGRKLPEVVIKQGKRQRKIQTSKIAVNSLDRPKVFPPACSAKIIPDLKRYVFDFHGSMTAQVRRFWRTCFRLELKSSV